MDTLNRPFGLVIAYILPGFIALAGVAPLSTLVAGWLSAGQQATSVSAPLYTLLAATATGMVVSCFRWLLVDQAHALTGLGGPAFNARALEERPVALTFLVEHHYRHYQFYANTLVATVWTYAVHRWRGTSPLLGVGTDLLVLILCAVLFAGSRDTLAKYRARSRQLVAQLSPTHSNVEGEPMANGIDHNEGSSSGAPKTPASKPTGKKAAEPKPVQKPQADRARQNQK
jgi:hypothetical protein